METLIDGFNEFSLDVLQNIQNHQPAGKKSINLVFLNKTKASIKKDKMLFSQVIH